jgi:diguanylate cyclase (GGDEF)-like protein
MEKKINSAVKKSFTDTLTKLNNREYFSVAVQGYLRDGKPGEMGAFYIIDLDYFKQINDGFGHDRGDTVLKSAARALSNIFSGEDEVVARMGGDEFVAFCAHIQTPEAAKEKGKEIGRQFRAIEYTEGKWVTASVGGAAFRMGEHAEYSELFSIADAALYDVKAAGRNGCRVTEKK